jgi:hypothetical protein
MLCIALVRSSRACIVRLSSHLRIGVGVSLLAGAPCATPPESAQSNDASLRLVVEDGTPLRVALDRRVVVRRVGQQVEAVLVDPIFAYDRIVIPTGTRVLGHVERRTAVSKKRRALAMLSGDFTPLHDILLQFDAIVLADGRTLPVRTQVSAGTEQVTLKLADGAQKKGNILSSAGEETVQQAKQTVAILKGPDKVERMKDTGCARCPITPSSSVRAPSSTPGCCPRLISARRRRRQPRTREPRLHRRASFRPDSSPRSTPRTRPEERRSRPSSLVRCFHRRTS